MSDYGSYTGKTCQPVESFSPLVGIALVFLTLGTAAIYPSLCLMCITVALVLKIRDISKERNGLFATLNFRDNTDRDSELHNNTKVDLRELEEIVDYGKLFETKNNDVKIEITECCSPELSRNRITSQISVTQSIPRKSKSEEFLSRLKQTFNEFPLIDETPTNSPIKSHQCQWSASIFPANGLQRVDCRIETRCSNERRMIQDSSLQASIDNIQSTKTKLNHMLTPQLLADNLLSVCSSDSVSQEKLALTIPQSQSQRQPFEREFVPESPTHIISRLSTQTQSHGRCVSPSTLKPRVFGRSKSSFIIRVPPPDSVLLSPMSALLQQPSAPLPTLPEDGVPPSLPAAQSPKCPRAPPPSPRANYGNSARRMSLQSFDSSGQKLLRGVGRSAAGGVMRANSRSSLVTAIGSIGSSTGSLALTVVSDARAMPAPFQKRPSELGKCFVVNNVNREKMHVF